MNEELKAEIQKLLNRYSRENESDTPDFILASYLYHCLEAFDRAVVAREKWYGRREDGKDNRERSVSVIGTESKQE